MFKHELMNLTLDHKPNHSSILLHTMNSVMNKQQRKRRRTTASNMSSFPQSRPSTSHLYTAGTWTLVCIAFLSAICFPPNTVSFQPQHRTIHSSTFASSLSRKVLPVLKVPSSSFKRTSEHYFALDYRDVSTRSKRSRLSLSSIAVSASSASSLVNDGTDYYSWLTSGWGNSNAFLGDSNIKEKTSNVFAPSKPTNTTTLSQTKEFQRRKEEWAERYTSLNGLRKAFGRNRNKLWGDLDPATTRKLYKSLLPNALCELVLELGVEPEELAPLAYQARKAAKLYARERCHVPARIAANLFDGFRQWRRYGRFQPTGMSYEQLWDKYYHQQLEEVGSSLHQHHEDKLHLDDTVTEDEIVSQTCQKILEKACTTNEMVDHMLLGERRQDHHHDSPRRHRNDLLLKRISRTLQRDVRKLLHPTVDTNASQPKRRLMTPREYHALKLFAQARRESEAQHLTESK